MENSEQKLVLGFSMLNGVTYIGTLEGMARVEDGFSRNGPFVSYPMILTMNQTTVRKDNKVGIAFIPANPLSKDDFIILDTNHIIFEFRPQDDIVDMYRRTVTKLTSKLELPPEKSIIV